MPAPKGNQNAVGNKGGGRPTLYKPEYAVMAKKLALLGSTDKQIADILQVSESTIADWKEKHVEFSTALFEGRDLADAQVASRIYNRACGYAHRDVHITSYEGVVTKTPIIKHYPPDTQAAIFWLKNRQKDKWRDKTELEATGKDGKDLIPVSDMEIARRAAFLLIQADKGKNHA